MGFALVKKGGLSIAHSIGCCNTRFLMFIFHLGSSPPPPPIYMVESINHIFITHHETWYRYGDHACARPGPLALPRLRRHALGEERRGDIAHDSRGRHVAELEPTLVTTQSAWKAPLALEANALFLVLDSSNRPTTVVLAHISLLSEVDWNFKKFSASLTSSYFYVPIFGLCGMKVCKTCPGPPYPGPTRTTRINWPGLLFFLQSCHIHLPFA